MKSFLVFAIPLEFLLAFLLGCQTTQRIDQGVSMKPLVIGHRGASGHTPEHTLHSYELAVDMGADYFEPDLVPTKDGILIVRHENEIGGTTDVAEKYPERKTTKTIDGEKMTGWFTEDFTLKEIKTLRAKERLDFRNQSQNGRYEIPTFEEVLDLREKLSKKNGVIIGIAPELKHSTYFRSIGLPLEERFIEIIKRRNLNRADAPIMVQSFEVENLKMLKKEIQLPLVQLLEAPEKSPYDYVKNKKKMTYLEMATPGGMKKVAEYATWISPWKHYIWTPDKDGKLTQPTPFVGLAHAAGLKVVPYTFRNENQYLSVNDKGSPESEYKRFFEVGVDAVFSDYPDTAVWSRDQYLKSKK